MNARDGRRDVRLDGAYHANEGTVTFKESLASWGDISEMFAKGAELQNPFALYEEGGLRELLQHIPFNPFIFALLLGAPDDRALAGRTLSGAALQIALSVGPDPGANSDDRACLSGDSDRCLPASKRWESASHPAALARAAKAAEIGCSAGLREVCSELALIQMERFSTSLAKQISGSLFDAIRTGALPLPQGAGSGD